MAAGATYTPIATANGSGSSSYIEFASIPSTYTDLVLVVFMKQSSGYTYAIRFNSDSGSNYSNTQHWAPNGSSTWTERATNTAEFNIGDINSSNGASSIIHVMNYKNTTTQKTVLVNHNDVGNTRVYNKVALWRSTAAINTIRIIGGGNFTTDTRATLYGIAAA